MRPTSRGPVKPKAPSSLAGRAVALQGGANATLDHLNLSEARSLSQRPPRWDWYTLAFGQQERWCLRDSPGRVLGAWCGSKKELTAHPTLVMERIQGEGFGALLMASAAARCLELGCEQLVLAALPGVTDFYNYLGGVPTSVAGFKPESGLIPYRWDVESLKGLAARL